METQHCLYMDYLAISQIFYESWFFVLPSSIFSLVPCDRLSWLASCYPSVFWQQVRVFASCPIVSDEIMRWLVDRSFSSSPFGWRFKVRTSISIDRSNDTATSTKYHVQAAAFNITTHDRNRIRQYTAVCRQMLSSTVSNTNHSLTSFGDKMYTIYTSIPYIGPTFEMKILWRKILCTYRLHVQKPYGYGYYTVSQKGTPSLSILTFKKINGF